MFHWRAKEVYSRCVSHMSGSGNEHIMFKGLWEETLTREGLGTVADTAW